MAHSLLRPGFMVSLKTSVSGGVQYQRRDLDADKGAIATANENAQVARWETTKVVEDPAEFERATKLRNEVRALVTKQCISTAFGLLCPESNEGELFAAIAEAKRRTRSFNDEAARTEVTIYVMTGKIASNDEENARAIADEVRALISDMNRSIDKLDPEALREAANKANKIGAMLAAEESDKVGAAVAAARKAARDITRLTKKGEQASIILADIQRGAIEQARIAFLDFDTSAPAPAGDELPAVDVQRVAGLDLDDSAETPSEPPATNAHSAPELDLSAADSDRYEAAASPAAYAAPEIEVAS